METILDLTEYRVSDLEKNRTENLMSLVEGISCSCKNALDIGARDGHFSRLLAGHFVNVTALDLQEPRIECKGVTCVKGDMTSLNFQDNSFEFVLCAEVLEHISPHLVKKACAELSRVSEKYILIGVPYKEDNRVGRTTCYTCGEKNPPWGHVNCFDEGRLINLFPNMEVKTVSYVGNNKSRTNAVSTLLMDLAGNPYGTYEQEELCINCGNKLMLPPERNIFQKVCTRAAFYANNLQKPFVKEYPNWIHILFEK